MSNIMSAADVTKGAGGGDFLTAEERAALADSRTPFWVVDAEPKSESQYGDQTLFFIRSKDAFGDEQRTLAFKHNRYREAIARNIAEAVAKGVQAVGPFWLGRYPLPNGKFSWDLLVEEPKDVTPPPAAVATPAQVGANQPSSDADLPF